MVCLEPDLLVSEREELHAWSLRRSRHNDDDVSAHFLESAVSVPVRPRIAKDPAPAGLLHRQAYRRMLRRDFASDLEFGSRLAKRVFFGRFLFGSVPARIVQFTRSSPKFAGIMQDLFAGTQSYLGLKRRLIENLNGSLLEIAMNVSLDRVVPGRVRA